MEATLTPLQSALKSAHLEDWTFLACPVIMVPNPPVPGQNIHTHNPFDFKALKALQEIVLQNEAYSSLCYECAGKQGDTSASPRGLTYGSQSLDGGDYSIWKSSLSDFCQEQAHLNQSNNVPITFEMLVGTGPFLD